MKNPFILFTALILCSGITHADEITNTINEALTQYKNGEYSEAVGNLDYASQMIRQKKSEGLADYLPQPLDGWELSNTESSAAGGAMLGGMVSAERIYKKATL